MCVCRGRFCGLCAAEGEHQQLYWWRRQDLLLLHGAKPGADCLSEPDQSVQSCSSLQGQRQELIQPPLTIIILMVSLGWQSSHNRFQVPARTWKKQLAVIWSASLIQSEWKVNGFRETFRYRCCFSAEWTSSWASLIMVSSLTVVLSVPLLPGKLQVHQPAPPIATTLPLFIAILPSSSSSSSFFLSTHFTCDQHLRCRQHAQQPFLEVCPLFPAPFLVAHAQWCNYTASCCP